MLCKELIRKLSEFLDGELGPAEAEELTSHLEHCEDCRIVVDTTRKTIEIYCNAEPIPIPDDVRIRLHQTLLQKCGRKPVA